MALIDDIKAAARRENRLIDSIDDAFLRELEGVLAGIERQIRRLISGLASTDGRLVANEAAIGRALRLRTELIEVVASAGWPAVSALDLDELAVETLKGRTIAARAARETPISIDTITALQELGQADLLRLGEGTAEALWRGTLDGVIGSRDATDLIDDLAEVVQVSKRQARTLHDTAVSTYARQVRQLGLPGEGGDRFLYVGPDDGVTRPFCQAQLADPIKTRDEIGSLSNGQLPNVLLTGGGFNCRHIWQFIGDLTDNDLEA